MAGIFVSYRRDDAAHVTGRIADALAARVGRENVFVDVDSVAPGEDFVRKIETTIRGSDIFLAVIGANWLSASTAQGQRRIDLPGDFIRLEVGTALAAAPPKIHRLRPRVGLLRPLTFKLPCKTNTPTKRLNAQRTATGLPATPTA